MGFSTTYLGRFDISPVLNREEVEWLRSYARMLDRDPDDPYAVPMNPGAAPLVEHPESRAGSTWRSDGLFRCDWQPCPDGCCLVWQGTEKSNNAMRELTYLIDHFLRPGAHAHRDQRSDFAAFTFDHVVKGVIAAERGDTRKLFLLEARDNEIVERTLVPGSSEW
ncbi:hypothetical protein [Luteipulveratus mongoliensis]|uniref:Uncharacterized protein n=1 Tax=Luteipulveratus mongoliensis TaxID=571913 RepID=A0A0K1JE92_9MICO|nr:hypothetical protein [Luteipulveratus mongoliensis]AKU15024.1 hypothetical protein VV02_02710 [Luteipulveratus mongoliensis]